jgi:hypothetical protein
MLAGEVVFSMEEEPYRWRDVILAAVRWGQWRLTERRAREGAACASHADEAGDPFPSDALDAAGRDFRYDRDLVTAQSMEDWLNRWGLTVKDWTDYLNRQYQRSRHPERCAELVAQHPLSNDEAAQLTLVEAICSGELEKWARTLASRAAVHARMAPATEAEIARAPRAEQQELESVATLLEMNESELTEATRRLEHLDESFDRFRASQLTERALKDYVGHHQLEWVRFNCRVMAFPDEGMASEAALLLREDNEGFTGVYSVAHTEPRTERFFLDQIEAPIRDRFLGARAGDLLGPMRVNDEYRLYQIEEKLLPNANDPEVRKRAEEGVLKTALARQADQKVQWHAAPSR